MLKKLSLLALLVGSLAQAQNIALVSGDDYKPYADSKLPEGGLTTELVKKAFAEVKSEVKIDWLPWKRGYDEAKEGRYAGTFPYLKTTEREQDFVYSDAIVKIQDFPFVKAGAKSLDFSKPESLAGTTLCLPLGWAPTTKLSEMIKSKTIKTESPKDLSSCVKMVATNRADYFITDEAQGTATVKNSDVPAGSIRKVDVVLSDTSLYLIASKKLPESKELIQSFNKGLALLRKNGTYPKVTKAHSN